MSAEEMFSSNIPDVQKLIKELDMMNDDINRIVRDAVNKGADIILAEQRRLAPYKLSEYIAKGAIYTNRKGVVGITVGYQPDVFKPDEKGRRYGLIGMTYEFGRPGTSDRRSSPKMKQTRKRIPNKKTAKRKNWKEAVPTEVEISKGTIQPVPHIRRGFDNVKEQAAQAAWDSITSELENIFNE